MVIAACLSVTAAGSAQDRTIPELMASANGDLAILTGVQFGAVPTLDSVLMSTDVVIRGVVAGEPRTYLSQDQKSVDSEYTIASPEIVDDPQGLLTEKSRSLGFAVAFTQPGGTIAVHGRKYTLIHDNFPPLLPGDEYLLLLKRDDGNTFRAAGLYFGVFRVKDDRLAPVRYDDTSATELNGLSAADAVKDIVARRRALRR